MSDGNGYGNGRHPMTESRFQWIMTTLLTVTTFGGGAWITYSTFQESRRDAEYHRRDEELREQNGTFERQLGAISESSIKTAAAVEYLAKETTRSDAAITALSTAVQSLSDRMTRIESRPSTGSP